MIGCGNWWAKYGLPEAVTARTLLSVMKLPRNIIVSRAFERRRVLGQDEVIARLSGMADRRLLCVIAYNLPWAVDLMARACARHLPDWRLLVLDNSSDPECRRANMEICSKADVTYIGLPSNPEWSPNRSHALALNWAYHNVIRVIQPALFGFLDHDCFPFSSAPALSRIEHQPVYGIRRHHPTVESSAWYLWAGYMFFNRDLVGDRCLDFNHDQIRLLDTGGRNWIRLYRYLNAENMLTAEVGAERIGSLDDQATFEVQRIDRAFLHVGGASYRQRGEQAGLYVSTVRAAIESSLLL